MEISNKPPSKGNTTWVKKNGQAFTYYKKYDAWVPVDFDLAFALLMEIDEYLSRNEKNYIGSGSILHTKVKNMLEQE